MLARIVVDVGSLDSGLLREGLDSGDGQNIGADCNESACEKLSSYTTFAAGGSN